VSKATLLRFQRKLCLQPRQRLREGINSNKTTLQQQQEIAAAAPHDPHPRQQPF